VQENSTGHEWQARISCIMNKKDENSLEKLANQLVSLMNTIYEAQTALNKIETKADALLRKLLKRNGKDNG
jgi:hypothetical protein